jgi:hypothetical protein
MNPSRLSAAAIPALSFEAGTSTSVPPVMLAFLILVSMSAMGSVMVICSVLLDDEAVCSARYQLAFRTPGISPLRARFLKQILQIPNLR